MDNYTEFSNEYLPRIEARIAAFFERCVHTSVSKVQANVYDAYSRFALRPGKRIRPLIMLIANRAWAENVDHRALTLASLIEIMHATLLVHDDIIDDADLRRGAPSLHRVFQSDPPGPGNARGEHIALIAADLLVFDCLEEALRSDIPPELLYEYAACYRQTNLGQLLDIAHEGSFFTEENVPAMVMRYKTASYTVVYPFLMGCALAGVLDETLRRACTDALYPLGENFQLRDDYLGIFATQDQTGKSANDLAASKYTSLIYDAWRLSADKRRFRELFGLKLKTHSDIVELMDMIKSSGAIEQLRRRMNGNFENFYERLEGLKLPARESEILVLLARKISTL